MSKMLYLKKQVTRESGIIAGGVVIAFVLSMVTGGLAEDATNNMNMAQSRYNQAVSQLGMMRGQIAKSADAEKRYVEIMVGRDNEEFLNDTENLKNLLKTMKDQYRFSDSMRLTISSDAVSNKPDYTPLNYKVIVRDDMEVNLAAISDVHVFSFMQDMDRRLPGLLRIKNFRLTRKAVMNMDSLTQMSTGGKPELVDATLKFTWITLEDKNPPKTEEAGAAAAGTPPSDPAMMGGQP